MFLKQQPKCVTYSKRNKNTVSRGTYEAKKKNGVSKGIPDFIVVIPAELCNLWRSILLFVEMKTPDGKPYDVKPEQRRRLEALKSRRRLNFVVSGATEAMNFVSDYLICPKKILIHKTTTKNYSKVIQIEFGWSIFTNSPNLCPAYQYTEEKTKSTSFRHYFTISIERIVSTGRIQFETTIPKTAATRRKYVLYFKKL